MNRQFGVPTLMNFNAHLYAGRRVCVNSVMLVVSCEAMDNVDMMVHITQYSPGWELIITLVGIASWAGAASN